MDLRLEEPNLQIGERIKQLIREVGPRAKDFASQLGIHQSAVSHLLGERNYPSYPIICKILTRFPKLNPEWLLLGKGSIWQTAPMSHTNQEAITQKKSSNLNPPPTTSSSFSTHQKKEPVSTTMNTESELLQDTTVDNFQYITTVIKPDLIVLQEDGTYIRYTPIAK